MSAFPSIRGPRREMAGIPGAPPDLAHPPSGCRFHPRCPQAMEICLTQEPELYARGDARVRCLLYADGDGESGDPVETGAAGDIASAGEPGDTPRADPVQEASETP